jgi:hypothetical protein
MVRMESEERQGALPEPAIEGSTRVEEADAEAAREGRVHMDSVELQMMGLAEGGAEAPE